MKLNELKAEIVRNGMTIEEFADSIGMERTTLWRRFNNADTFALGEIRTMSNVLKIKGSRILEIFFADEVA